MHVLSRTRSVTYWYERSVILCSLRTVVIATVVNWLLEQSTMGNVSCSVSGFGAGDASRKSVRGSRRSCKRQRATSSCCHYADNNWLVDVLGDQHGAKLSRQKRGQTTKNEVTKALSTAVLEELLDDCAGLYPEKVDLDVSYDCVSPCSDAGSREGSGAGSGYFSDDYQLVSSLRDEADEEEEDNDEMLVVCEEDRAMMMLNTPTTICGEEWINWTALCPCCRRDASDDSIDLQEMIKLEPIRASTTPPIVLIMYNIRCSYSPVKHVLSILSINLTCFRFISYILRSLWVLRGDPLIHKTYRICTKSQILEDPRSAPPLRGTLEF